MAALLILPTRTQAQKHELVNAKDGSGVFGYKDTPMQPWSGFHVHDPDRPAPPVVTPPPPTAAEQAAAPSDALVLFDGRDVAQWEPNKWKVEDGCLVATEGPMRTKEEFGDCQLHLEWMVPTEPAESIWNRGNNGVFLLGVIEVQVFDSSVGQDLSRRPSGGGLRPDAAAGERLSQAGRVADLRHRVHRAQVRRCRQADGARPADHVPQRRPGASTTRRSTAPRRMPAWPVTTASRPKARSRWAPTTARSASATSGSGVCSPASGKKPGLRSSKFRISSGSSRIPKNSGGRGLDAALRNAPNSGEFGYAQLRRLR